MSTERPPGDDGPDGEEEAAGSDGRHEGVDVDAAWAQILAHWDDPAPARSPARQHGSAAGERDAAPGRGAPPGRPAPGDDRPGRHRLDGTGPGAVPAAGDGPAASAADQRRRRTDPRPEPTRPPAAPPTPSPRYDAGGGTDADPLAEDHWTPPEPPPLPRSGWRGWLPWVGVLGVPFFFVVVVITKPSLPPVVMLVAVLGFVAGFVTLVMRLPSHRDDDGDDGARV